MTGAVALSVDADVSTPTLLPMEQPTLAVSRTTNQSANQQIIRSSARHSATSLFCKPRQSNYDLIRPTRTKSLTGSCTGTVNEVVHCDEWVGEVCHPFKCLVH